MGLASETIISRISGGSESKLAAMVVVMKEVVSTGPELILISSDTDCLRLTTSPGVEKLPCSTDFSNQISYVIPIFGECCGLTVEGRGGFFDEIYQSSHDCAWSYPKCITMLKSRFIPNSDNIYSIEIKSNCQISNSTRLFLFQMTQVEVMKYS